MNSHRTARRTNSFSSALVSLSIVFAALMLSGCSDSRTYTVSGTITSGGAPLSGITVNLADNNSSFTATAITDASGKYSFTDIAGGIYTVTPSKTTFGIFTPPLRRAYLDGLSATEFNFSITNAGRLSGTNHTIFLRTDGTVWTWGDNSNGQLGNGSTADSSVPVNVAVLTGVTAVSAGNTHSVALRLESGATTTTVWTWGNNASGQLGDGTTDQRTMPVQVINLDSVVAVSAGSDHTVALKNDGTVWAWGKNDTGQLGNGSTLASAAPVQVTGLSNIIAVAAGANFTLALKNDDTVWAWGKNDTGQLGNGSTSSSATPVQVSGLVNVVAIGAGDTHGIAIRSDATTLSVWTWGNNTNGQLGVGTTTQHTTPVQVPDLKDVASVAAGADHTVALKTDGTVLAWGSNGNGQLGNGSTTQSDAPVQASGLSGIIAVAGGSQYSMALKNDNTVWTWGSNGNGRLGNGTTTDSLTPVQALVP